MQCKVINSLYNTINSIRLRQKEPRIIKDKIALNQADLKLIDAVALHPDLNASSMAAVLNVSRGAISQAVNRLEQLAIVKRVPVAGNRKEKLIQLTVSGKEIKKEKDRNHQQANAEMCSFLKGLSAEQLEAIMMFLDKAKILDFSRFDCLDSFCTNERKEQQNA
ncbi:MAG TPA: MarR family transcriptional regulator [Erysipelotrichaceae bacterium]|nr:MarR family transcriptional regulator [Erysipelotrichaceae bacterium]HQB32235.1 MarR family transcriptional regulator [Erysipelotrichaceae bacterium]